MRLTVYEDWETLSGKKETVEVIRELSSGLPFLLTDAPDKSTVLYFGRCFEVKHKDGRVSRRWKRYRYRKSKVSTSMLERLDLSWMSRKDTFLTIHGIEIY